MRALRLLSAGLIAAAVAGCATSGYGYRDGYSRDYYGDRYYDQGYYGPSAGVTYRYGQPYGSRYGGYYGYGQPGYGYGSPYGYGYGSPYGYGYSGNPYGYGGGYYGSPYGYGYPYQPPVIIVRPPNTIQPPDPTGPIGHNTRDDIGRRLRIMKGLEGPPPPGGSMPIPVPEQARVQQREGFQSRAMDRDTRQRVERVRHQRMDGEIESETP